MKTRISCKLVTDRKCIMDWWQGLMQMIIEDKDSHYLAREANVDGILIS